MTNQEAGLPRGQLDWTTHKNLIVKYDMCHNPSVFHDKILYLCGKRVKGSVKYLVHAKNYVHSKDKTEDVGCGRRCIC